MPFFDDKKREGRRKKEEVFVFSFSRYYTAVPK
jgi:hypothetical protein